MSAHRLGLHLVDTDPLLVHAWREAFEGLPDVTWETGDILELATGAIVSPSNSAGHLDGGIDQAFRTFFGEELQRRVYAAVARRPEGHLPVGAAEIVATGHTRIAWIILAPTMFEPEPVPAVHAYRAMRAALRVARRERLGELTCPGLGTGIGSIAPDDAAREMAAAYRAWLAS